MLCQSCIIQVCLVAFGVWLWGLFILPFEPSRFVMLCNLIFFRRIVRSINAGHKALVSNQAIEVLRDLNYFLRMLPRRMDPHYVQSAFPLTPNFTKDSFHKDGESGEAGKVIHSDTATKPFTECI